MVALKTGTLEFDGFRIDPLNAELRRGSDPIALAPKPFAVLCHLIEHRGELVTKEALLDAVWPNLHVSESSLSFAINAVRAALGDDARTPRYIQTVPRRGYRFIAQPAAKISEEPEPPGAPDQPRRAFVATTNQNCWVGRDGPLDTLEALLNKAGGGDRQVVFVTGEGGIGKTTLIDMMVARLAQRGAGLLRGRCTELFGTAEAFLPLIEALQDRCASTDGPALLRTLRDHAPTWLAQMPSFLDTADRTAFQTTVFGATRERMLREFCEFLEVVSAERPWVVIIEDLHWGDPATVDVVSRFARRDRRASVLLLATYRPAEVVVDAHPIRDVHQDLQIHRLCSELALDRLSPADVENYLKLRFDGAAMCDTLADRVFRRTQGQPLFVVSLVDYFVAQDIIRATDDQWRLADETMISQSGLPHDLREMISRQIDRLSAEEQRILEVASAAGADFAAALIAGAMGKSELEVEQICETLVRKGQVLTAAGVSEWPDGTVSGRYTFQHDLHQEVLYRRLAPGQRVQTHRRLGERLEAAYLGAPMDVASILAAHFEEGRAPVRAVRYLGLAAENSAKRFGNLEAANYLTRALELLDQLPAQDQEMTRTELLRQRGWVRRAAGDYSGAIQDLIAMIGSAADAGQLRQEVSGLLDLSRFCLHADRQLSLRAAEQASVKSQALNDDVFRSLVQGSSASLKLYLQGWQDDDAALCRTAVDMAEQAQEPDVLVRRFGIQGLLTCMTADYRSCLAAARRVKGLALANGDVYLIMIFNNLESVALLQLGEWRQLRRNTDAALAMAEKNANRHAAAMCRLMSAWLHTEALNFPAAIDLCRQAEDPALDGIPLIFFVRRIISAKAHTGAGDLAAAGRLFQQIADRMAVNPTGTDYTVLTQIHGGHCEYWLTAGDLAQAHQQAMQLHGLVSAAPDSNNLALAHWYLARIAMAGGDLTEAGAQLSAATGMLKDRELPHAAWRIYRTAADYHARAGDTRMAGEFRRMHDAVVHALADNFDHDDRTREHFLRG